MKIAGQEQLIGNGQGRTSMRDLLSYSLSLPVAACIVGMPKAEFVRENIETARSFQPLSDAEKDRIRKAVEPSAVAFDRFLRHHSDFA